MTLLAMVAVCLLALRVRRLRTMAAGMVDWTAGHLGFKPWLDRVVERNGPGWLRGWRMLCRILAGVFCCVAALLVVTVGFVDTVELWSPMELPKAVLTNGRQTVVFEGMVHIGSQRFYDSVREDIRKAVADGYVYYYESVQHSQSASHNDALNTYLLGQSTEGMDLMAVYSLTAHLAGLQLQPQAGFVSAGGAASVDADVSVDELYEHIDQRHLDTFLQTKAVTGLGADDLKRVSDSFDHLPRWAADTVRWSLRSLISTATRMPHGLGGHMNAQAAALVLDYRNARLAQSIETGPERIIVTYGAAHLPGLLADLKLADPSWRIASQTARRVLD